MKREYDDDETNEDRPPETPSSEDSDDPSNEPMPEDLKATEKKEALKTLLEEKYQEFPGSEHWTEGYLFSSAKDEEEINAMNDVERSEILEKRHEVFRDIKQYRAELKNAMSADQQPPPAKKSKRGDRSSTSRKSDKHKKSRDYSTDEEEENYDEEEEEEDEDIDEEEENYDDEEEEDDDEDDYEDESDRRRSKKKEKKEKKKKTKHSKHHKYSDDDEDDRKIFERSKKHSSDYDEDDGGVRTPSPRQSDDESGTEYDEKNKKKEALKKGYPIEFKDLKSLQIKRTQVFENMYRPGFKDAVKGMFVKSKRLQGNSYVSKMLKITGVTRTEEYAYGKDHGQRTDIVLLIKSPEEPQDSQLQVQYVSEQDITEAEFDNYKSAAERVGEPIIEKSIKKIHNNYFACLKRQFTGKELEELRRRKSAMPDIYLRKDKLVRSITTLKGDNADGNNDSRIADLTAQLKDVLAQIDAYERKKREEIIKLEKRSAAGSAAQMQYRDPSLKAYKKALAIAMAGRQEEKPPVANKLDLVKGVMSGKASKDDLIKYYNFELDLDAPLRLRQPTLGYPVPPLPADAKVITLADYASAHH